MPQIIVENLVKTFKVAEREPGLIGAFKGLASRRYKTIRALDGIGFTLEKGELVGYIGPNGAGKSTTVKILSGILVPDSGRVEIMGRDKFLDIHLHAQPRLSRKPGWDDMHSGSWHSHSARRSD